MLLTCALIKQCLPTVYLPAVFPSLTCQLCDLVSLLVFQKAVQFGGLALAGCRHAGRLVAGSASQPGCDVPATWGLMGLKHWSSWN